MSPARRLAWMVLILLLAAFLRWHDLPHAPPGLTHDEADHGLDAWGVVQGVRPIYFTVGYGREPLYDYSTALLMSFLGPSHLAGRLTSVFFSFILIAGAYAWGRQAFNSRVALLTAAALALSFWPLMTARQGLRSETLPALFVVVAALYWKGLKERDLRLETGDLEVRQSLISNLQSPRLLASLLLGLTFYTYIPARALWLVFPALLLYLWLRRERAPWRQTLIMLLIAALVGLPLFAYLLANPGAEVRIDQLAEPLRQAGRGDLSALWANARSGLGIIAFSGDTQWRYNIAGRPLLTPLGAALFAAGLLWSVWRVLACLRQRHVGCRCARGLFFALCWLALGLAPVLVTGRDLGTTQAIGMQPVLYLFPALALDRLARRLQTPLKRSPLPAPPLMLATALVLGALLSATTWRDYFQVWATHPQVAVQYEAELVAIIRELNAAAAQDAAIAISSDAPGAFHDSAVARLYLNQERRALRWFDGRSGLLLPQAPGALLVFSETAPLDPLLRPYLEALQPTPLAFDTAPAAWRLTHIPAQLLQLYPHFSTEINTLSTELSTELLFGDVLQLLGYQLHGGAPQAGAVVELVTVWQVRRAPAEELVLFTHLLDAAGNPLAQADRLDAPTHSWRAGDLLVQLHTLQLPAALEPGAYPLSIGVYDAADWRRRLPVTIGGEVAGDALQLTTLEVTP